jgi:DNA modification methylase
MVGRGIKAVELNTIMTGDARELAKTIPDESVDMVFCDPVYSNIDDYRWLAETAMRVLKPDSACLAWCSKAGESQFAMQESGLNYHWTLNYTVQAKPTLLFHYGLFTWTTPCLFFAKGHRKASPPIPDTFISKAPPDNGFKWNKNIEVINRWMRSFTKPGDIVYDPFAGSGTVPAVCKMTGRNYLASEIDPVRAATARQRVEQAPMPLFVLENEKQAVWDLEEAI